MRLKPKLKRELRQKSLYLGTMAVIVFLIMLFKIDLIRITSIIILIILASFSKIYKRITSISLGFELITPVTILLAYKTEVIFTVFAALIMLLASSFISTKIKFPEVLIQWVVYIIIIIVTTLFLSADFRILAIVMIFVRLLVLTPLTVVLLGENFIEVIIYLLGNTFLNIFIIVTFSNFALSLL